MKRYLDSSVLVEACLARSPHFAAADALVRSPDSVTSTHALAECFATLSGNPYLRLSPATAAQLPLDLLRELSLVELSGALYRETLARAAGRGIRGGLIYDALHAAAAELSGCNEIITLNLSHFRHLRLRAIVKGLDH